MDKKREFLQLAAKFNPDRHNVIGYYLSEKLDGTRCFWDGGLTRGMRTENVPWAGLIDPKTGDKKKKIKPYSTGLWSRYGNPIIAPDSFLNQLPCCFLDGELWAGYGNFQLCRSICGGDEPDPRFDANIVYAIYSSPAASHVFATGEIKNTNMAVGIDYILIEEWIREQKRKNKTGFSHNITYPPPGATFADEIAFLQMALENTEATCYLHPQVKITNPQQIEDKLQKVLDAGGEGVVIRSPDSLWIPKRHTGVLKYKPFTDAEAIIIGFTAGRTGKTGHLLGKIGALITDYKGKRLEIAGLTDAEREFSTEAAIEWATDHPGEDMPSWIDGKQFKHRQKVTFIYRELSDDDIPKEARYYRDRDNE